MMKVLLLLGMLLSSSYAVSQTFISEMDSIKTGADSIQTLDFNGNYSHVELHIKNPGNGNDTYEIKNITMRNGYIYDTTDIVATGLKDYYVYTNITQAEATALGILRVNYNVPAASTRGFKFIGRVDRLWIRRTSAFVSGNADAFFVISK